MVDVKLNNGNDMVAKRGCIQVTHTVYVAG